MKILKKTLVIFLMSCIFSSNPCFGFSMADKLLTGSKGDFIVTEQDKNYAVMIIRSNKESSIIIEEVSAPSSALSRKTNWKKWITEGAPGHVSWVMYELDKNTFSLLESYSFTMKGWLFLNDSEHFLSRLLGLPLEKVSAELRKKTGPAPHGDEVDRRKIWNPVVTYEGEKIKSECEAFKGKWPKDGTLLSECTIQIYFNRQHQAFCFPYWIEASNGHYTYAIKTIDSGKNIISPIQGSIPHRPPKIQSIAKSKNSVVFTIRSPRYHKNFSLFCFDVVKPSEKIGPIPITITQDKEKELTTICASTEDLSKYLLVGHRYKWILKPENSELFVTESEDFFLWPSVANK